MSIQFSEITMSAQNEFDTQFLIDGHPDEDDLRKNEHLLFQLSLFPHLTQVRVQRYGFLTHAGDGNADQNHFALISTYDELAALCNRLNPRHSVGMFTDRDDVEHGDYFTFSFDDKKEDEVL